ncbi:topoisomerase, partial [Pseudoflavonifractor phocaeensis]|nr:topoisomerase [Pseudoflavonifractor phocaeensis]
SWIGEYDITADELLSGAGGNTATKTEQAEKLILDLLADGKELASEDIDKAAAEAGISARTVRAAKKNLDGRITSKRIGAAWYHALKK